MKRVSFVFFIGTKDCDHFYVLRGTGTSGFVFRDTVIFISFGFSFIEICQYGYWYYLWGFDHNKLSFLLFNKGCLRISSVLEICLSYSIQVQYMTNNHI